MKRPEALSLKRPCANCPFLKEGAIELAPGRLAGIIKELEGDDRAVFNCHKTLRRDGYEGEEKICAGHVAMQLKRGRVSVAMRFALMTGLVTEASYEAAKRITVEPQDVVGLE